MKKTKLLFPFMLFIIGIFASGCQTSIYTLTNEEKSFPSSNISNISVTTLDKIDKAHQELGFIFAWGSTMEESIKNLKKKASEIGSDGIIKLEVTILRNFLIIIFIPIPYDTYYCSGIAIKYN
jgi:hypothetical protein